VTSLSQDPILNPNASEMAQWHSPFVDSTFSTQGKHSSEMEEEEEVLTKETVSTESDYLSEGWSDQEYQEFTKSILQLVQAPVRNVPFAAESSRTKTSATKKRGFAIIKRKRKNK
jgi:beta-lactamase regulating signal transducer with metallopeptidase domain